MRCTKNKVVSAREYNLWHAGYGYKVVFTNGCFDLLHVGHVRYLEEAKRFGDILVVGVNDDDSVKVLKGPTRPINLLADRMEVLASLEYVDFVVPMHATTNCELLKDIGPGVWVKGGDYTLETLNSEEKKIAEELGIQIVLLNLTEGYSTTKMLNALLTP